MSPYWRLAILERLSPETTTYVSCDATCPVVPTLPCSGGATGGSDAVDELPDWTFEKSALGFSSFFPSLSKIPTSKSPSVRTDRRLPSCTTTLLQHHSYRPP